MPSFLLPEHNVDSKDVNLAIPIKTQQKENDNEIKQEQLQSKESKGISTNKEEETFKDHQLSIREVEAEKNFDSHTFDAESKYFK